MKAFVLSGFEAPAEFCEVREPSPGPGDIRVHVHATSVNPVDGLVARGFFRLAQEYRFPAVFGRDFAGIVDMVGPGVERFREGDEVFGFVKRGYIGDGTFADYVVLPEHMFVGAKPHGMGFTEAATLGLAGITAQECVDAVNADTGDVVVVSGATGGLGTFAVQIAKARGATVVATARSTEKAALVRSLGADLVVNPDEGDLVELVRTHFPDGAQGFVDLAKRSTPPVMGHDSEGPAHHEFARLAQGLLRPGGHATSVTNGGQPNLMGNVTYTNVHSTPTPAALARLADLAAAGALTPVIAATYDFDRIDEAFTRMRQGVQGKIAVRVNEASP